MSTVEPGTLRTADTTKKFEIHFPSDPAYMCVVRQATSAMAALAGLPDREVDLVTLAVDEACTNVIKYAYHYDYSKEIILSFEVLPDRLEFALRDFGMQCDVASIRGRDLEDVRPGGLGVFIIREVMDRVEYDTGHSCGTELRMTRFLPGRKP